MQKSDTQGRERILRCGRLAKRAMTHHKYKWAYSLVGEIPGDIGVSMWLLVMEHELGFLRSKGVAV